MKFQNHTLRRLAGFSICNLTRCWMSTLDCHAAAYDRAIDPAQIDFEGPAIFVFWHEYILAPFYLRPHCNLSMLLSRHRDGDWLAEAARFMGFGVVRGSTFRGGGAALREMTRVAQTTNIAITPDGPRGPRRKLAQGPVYLASTSGIPIIPLGLAYDRPWRMPTWDRFAVPRPYSRCRAVVGPKLWIPPDLDRAGVEHYRQRVEKLLNRFTHEAEAWAASGTGKQDQFPARPQAAPLDRPFAEMWSRPVIGEESECQRHHAEDVVSGKAA